MVSLFWMIKYAKKSKHCGGFLFFTFNWKFCQSLLIYLVRIQLIVYKKETVFKYFSFTRKNSNLVICRVLHRLFPIYQRILIEIFCRIEFERQCLEKIMQLCRPLLPTFLHASYVASSDPSPSKIVR